MTTTEFEQSHKCKNFPNTCHNLIEQKSQNDLNDYLVRCSTAIIGENPTQIKGKEDEYKKSGRKSGRVSFTWRVNSLVFLEESAKSHVTAH